MLYIDRELMLITFIHIYLMTTSNSDEIHVEIHHTLFKNSNRTYLNIILIQIVHLMRKFSDDKMKKTKLVKIVVAQFYCKRCYINIEICEQSLRSLSLYKSG